MFTSLRSQLTHARGRLGPERIRIAKHALLIGIGTKALITLVSMFAVVTTFVHPIVAKSQGAAWDFTAPWDGLVFLLGRWDASWYAGIADQGYAFNPNAPAFFPLYPFAEKAFSPVFGGALNAGIIITFVATFPVLYLLGRITAHELGAGADDRAMIYLALFPTAIFLMAAYPEAVFLALSLGSVWAARRCRFEAAALWGFLATMTKPAGVLLLIPLAILFVQHQGGLRKAVRWSATWLLLVPAGIAAYSVILWVQVGDPFRFVGAQDLWHRTLATPAEGLWNASISIWDGMRQLAIGTDGTVFGPGHAGAPVFDAMHAVYNGVFLAGIIFAVVLAFRFLPSAYGWFAVGNVLLILSTAASDQPLLSIQRFALIIFPTFMALAAWTTGRAGRNAAVISIFSVLLGATIVQWAAWHWVG